MQTSLAFLKRCGALGTGWLRKYRNDFFLRTEVNIIALVVLYALVVLGLAIGSLIFLYQSIVTGIVAAMVTVLTASSTPFSADTVATNLESVRAQEIVAVAALVCVFAAVFGYLMARFALAPTRGVLAAQKQFIGNIAHELRTPLAIIKANTEVRLFDLEPNSEGRLVLESNLEELDRISNIINNLLTLNTLVQPERMQFTDVDMVLVAERAVAHLAPLAKRRNVTLQILPGQGRFARGDVSALEQVLTNIIKNAIQHTEEGEVVIMIDGGKSADLEVSVRDTGAGIRPEDLQRIFEPFYRGDRARSRAGGSGSGLGLTIVSELVKLHEGRISLRSVLKEGTTVVVALPKGMDPESMEPAQLSGEVTIDFSKQK